MSKNLSAHEIAWKIVRNNGLTEEINEHIIAENKTYRANVLNHLYDIEPDLVNEVCKEIEKSLLGIDPTYFDHN